MPKKKTYKRPRQIAVYAPDPLVEKLREDARRQNRKLGPMVLEIIREHYKKQETDAHA